VGGRRMGRANPDFDRSRCGRVPSMVCRCVAAGGLLVAWLGSSGSAYAAAPFANGGIVFATGGFAHSRIVSAAPDGSSPTQITFGPGQDDNPAFAADGRTIAFESTRTGNGDIYLMQPDGTGLVRLTTSPAGEGQPSWSPDGARIAYTRCGPRDCDVWVMNSDGTNQHQIVDPPGRDDLATDPAWSPDGRLIAFRDPHPCRNEIWVVRPDGTHPRAVTNIPCGVCADDLGPHWSPGGSRIVFWRETCRFRQDVFRIMVVRRDGSHDHPIASSTAGVFSPTWAPDGQQIIFVLRRAHAFQVVAVRPDGKDPIAVVARGRSPAWQPRPCSVTGTAGPDHLVGTANDDVICGLAGHDVIEGRGGNDVVSGGTGRHDTLSLGWASHGATVRVPMHAAIEGVEYLSGVEDVFGSPFADLLRGGQVANLLRGGKGNDDLRGGSGNDFIDARDGAPGDVLHGGSGTNRCRFDPGDSVHRC
jgi:dipeptidyl aminopeptidase/acylaminoacyl peptidase